MNRGAARGAKEDLDGAIADSTRALELDPRLAPAFCVRGLARGARGDAERAIADLTRYLELAPSAKDAEEVRTKIAELRRAR